MAGITVPTLVLLLIMSADAIHRSYFAASTIWVLDIEVTRLERALVFPMAFVPNLWGLWNIIYVAFLSRRHVSIGAFGALLPFLLAPGGWWMAHLFGLPIPRVAPFLFPLGVIAYYLLWKHVVGRLNAIIGVA